MMRKSDRDRDERGDRGDRGGRFGDRDRGFGDRDRGERRPRHDDAAATTGSEE